MNESQPVRCLLIEDDPDHAELVLGCLRETKVTNEVYHVVDGQAGLDFLLHHGDYVDPVAFPRPHMILLDLRLPKVDGFEVLRVIKSTESIKKIPVVILSTSDADKDIARAYEFNANSYLVKPVDFEQFDQLIRDLDYYWMVWNRQPSA